MLFGSRQSAIDALELHGSLRLTRMQLSDGQSTTMATMAGECSPHHVAVVNFPKRCVFPDWELVYQVVRSISLSS